MTTFTFFFAKVMQMLFKSSFYLINNIYTMCTGSDSFSDQKAMDMTNYSTS
ncbi:hypothetical protein [Aquimarina sp. AU58]|uniref:hypothetical protein n=1 Tax=Aquimarina sp. AU58 TaxID=1874112 RepID=UPI001357EDAB|nr:hypothetical protein [Aquimarina sp. AU58]